MSSNLHTPLIEVVQGDIADVHTHQCEVCVNAANNELWMGAGVAGALKRAAGDEVEREAIAQGPIEVGDAVITSAGSLPPPARAIIHAAAMGFTDRTQIYATGDTAYHATRRSLQLCEENHLTSIVFPALGTGVGALDDAECAIAMMRAVSDHVRSGTALRRVRFVVTSADRARIFRDAVPGDLTNASADSNSD